MRCEGNMDLQGELMRLVVYALAGNVCFLPRGCSVLLTVHGPQLTFKGAEHPGTRAEDNCRSWSSDQGLLVLSLTICLAFSLVSKDFVSMPVLKFLGL